MNQKATKKLQKNVGLNPMCFLSFLFASISVSNSVFASNADWLSFDLSATTQSENVSQARKNSTLYFDDELASQITVTQNIRIMMGQESVDQLSLLVDSMIQDQDVTAQEWMRAMPQSKFQNGKKPSVTNECSLNEKTSRITCDDSKRLSIDIGTASQAPEQDVLDHKVFLGSDLASSKTTLDRLENVALGNQPSEPQKGHEDDAVILKVRKDGLITAAGGVVQFVNDHQSKKVKLAATLSPTTLSVFVRDPSVLEWNESSKLLTAKKIGSTEIFVVTPGRISIIEAKVLGDTQPAAIAKNSSKTSPSALTVAVDANLASLDGLDSALSKGNLQASFGGSGAAIAEDLTVSDEVSKLGTQTINSNAQFVRAKQKANFENIKIKIVDERSVLNGPNFPVGGARVRIAGTEFSELTNSQGELEIRDVPVGGRILLDISDSRGYLMPQIVEVVADRGGQSRENAQTITARRYSSLDFIARSGGVTQDMQKSSLCGVISKSMKPQAGVSISLDTKAMGPYYFNNLGLVDMRIGATASNGRFCFFNVDPGPVAIGLTTSSGEQVSGVLGVVPGRHFEEQFDLADVRHVTTTLTTIATANEQLGSDASRSSRHDIVDQADVYAIGTGQLMVPVDEGIMTTASAVLPVKGRVWTVSSSSDFEPSVQAVSVRAPANKQISTLVPNGFVSDMSEYSQTVHNTDDGSVIVEHGNLTGHGADSVKMRLVDGFGRDVGDGWYFSDRPVSKSIFFNVPPGVYALIVETSAGTWIAADTVLVYSESVSVAKTGGQLEKVPIASQHVSLE